MYSSAIYSLRKDLHFYHNDDIGQLNVLIGKQNSLETVMHTGKPKDLSEVVWLVQVPFSNKAHLKDIFRRTPLRLDSNVYAVVKESQGLFIDHTILF